jgi:hypothetical protein
VDCTTTNVYQTRGIAESVVYNDFSVPNNKRLDVTLN